MFLRAINVERNDKLKSMFMDQMVHERELLNDAFLRLSITETGMNRLNDAIAFILNHEFEDSDFDRFYPAHAMRVTRFVANFINPKSPCLVDALVTAIVHNSLEKEIISKVELGNRFGSWAQKAIIALTQDREAMKTVSGRRAYYDTLYSMEKEVFLIKTCDKFDNLFAQCLWDDEHRRESYYVEVENYIQPLLPKVAPSLLPYWKVLLIENRKLGYYRPEYAL